MQINRYYDNYLPSTSLLNCCRIFSRVTWTQPIKLFYSSLTLIKSFIYFTFSVTGTKFFWFSALFREIPCLLLKEIFTFTHQLQSHWFRSSAISTFASEFNTTNVAVSLPLVQNLDKQEQKKSEDIEKKHSSTNKQVSFRLKNTFVTKSLSINISLWTKPSRHLSYKKISLWVDPSQQASETTDICIAASSSSSSVQVRASKPLDWVRKPVLRHTLFLITLE